MEVRRYGRYWAVYDGTVCVVVAVYKQGAQEMVKRLTATAEAMPPPLRLHQNVTRIPWLHGEEKSR